VLCVGGRGIYAGYIYLDFVAEDKVSACAREEKTREGGSLVGIIFKVRALLVQQGYLNVRDKHS
jgi:hypothetical protein